MISIGLCLVSVFIVLITYWIHRWKNPTCKGTLPPGSLGFPIIGESVQLLVSSSNSLDLHPFFKRRIQRYGPLFKTTILGRHVVVTADPEANHFILQQEGKLVELSYLDAAALLFGHDDSSTHDSTGPIHKYIRILIMNHFGYETLKKKLLNQVEALAHKSLLTWSTQPSSIDLNRTISLTIFDFISKELFSYDPTRFPESMGVAFIDFLECLASIPLNIPGTSFHRCLKNQKKTMKILMEIIEERCASIEARHGDFLDYFLEDMKKETFINKDFIAFVMFGLLFATFESIPTMLSLTIKLVTEHPRVLQELKDEHDAILKNRGTSNFTLTWEDYKSMTFTQNVIHETLRMANVGMGNFRKALDDININGYTIPKGWTVLVVSSVLHMDPNVYPDPLVFNPWRWKDGGSKTTTKNFTPFGGGIRYCPGAELSKMTIAIFLHVVVTKYRFTTIKGGNLVRNPVLKFKDGFHVRVSEKTSGR